MQPEPLHWHTLQPSEKPQAMCSCSSPEMADRGLKSPDCTIRGTHLSCEDPDCPGFDVCAPCYQLHDLQTKEALSSVQGYIRDGRYQRMPVVPHAGASESFAHLAQEPTLEEARQLIGRYRTSLALAEATVKGTIAKATAAVLKVLGDFGEACDRILSLEPVERLNSRPARPPTAAEGAVEEARARVREKARQAEAARLLARAQGREAEARAEGRQGQSHEKEEEDLEEEEEREEEEEEGGGAVAMRADLLWAYSAVRAEALPSTSRGVPRAPLPRLLEALRVGLLVDTSQRVFTTARSLVLSNGAVAERRRPSLRALLDELGRASKLLRRIASSTRWVPSVQPSKRSKRSSLICWTGARWMPP